MSDQVVYSAGEKRCEACGTPLGQIACSRMQTRFVCSKSECRRLHAQCTIQFLPTGHLCDAAGCTRPAVQRAYPAHQVKFYCSDECRDKSRNPRIAVRVICNHCGADLGFRLPTPSGRHYCSQHRAISRKLEADRRYCGPLLSVYEEYESYADSKYADSVTPKHVVRTFLGFLRKEGVKNISAVTVDHIGQYIADAVTKGGTPRPDFLKIFFDFLVNKRLYTGRNPVRGKIHYQRDARNAPRPYQIGEVRQMLRWLDERGDTQQHAIFSLALESGPTSAEICDVRVPDVSIAERKVWYRSSQLEGSAEQFSHWAPMGKKAANWLDKWLRERPDCGHDRLFINARGEPLKEWSLRDSMNAVFLRRSKFRAYSEGLEHFSLARIRDTNIWNMRCGGMEDTENRTMHGMLAVASIKRFDRLLTDKEIEQYSNAVNEMATGRGRNAKVSARAQKELPEA